MKNIERHSNKSARVLVGWRAQCYAQWQRAAATWRIETILPDSLRLGLTTKPYSYKSTEKNGIWLVISRHLEPIFCMQDFHFLIDKVQYQGQIRYLDTQEFFTANLWSTHIIAFDIDWSWNIFLSHIFYQCSSSRSSISEKWKLRTWNLGQIFRSEVPDQDMDGLSVAQ